MEGQNGKREREFPLFFPLCFFSYHVFLVVACVGCGFDIISV